MSGFNDLATILKRRGYERPKTIAKKSVEDSSPNTVGDVKAQDLLKTTLAKNTPHKSEEERINHVVNEIKKSSISQVKKDTYDTLLSKEEQAKAKQTLEDKKETERQEKEIERQKAIKAAERPQYTASTEMTETEYNRRRVSNKNLPKYGSYQYLRNREDELGLLLDKANKELDKLNFEGMFDNTTDIIKKVESGELKTKIYKDFVAAYKYQNNLKHNYENVLSRLSELENTRGINRDANGEIDIKGGKKESQREKERYNRIIDSNKGRTNEDLFNYAKGIVTPEADKVVSANRDISISYDKEKAYNYYDKHKDNAYTDNLSGKIAGNYRQGDISERTGGAGYTVFANRSDNLEAVEIYQELAKRLQERNESTFENNNAFDKGLATISSYIPQFINQTKAYLTGAAIGGVAAGMATGVAGAAKGARAGGAAGSAEYIFRQTAGQAYIQYLQEVGLSIKDARKMAGNEALASAVVEFGLEYAAGKLFSGGKKVAKAASEKVASTARTQMLGKIGPLFAKTGLSKAGTQKIVSAAKAAGKFALNSLGEGVEEWLQTGIEKTALEYAKYGKSASSVELLLQSLDLTRYSADDFAEMGEAFLGGATIGIAMGGTKFISSATVDKIASTVTEKRAERNIGKIINNSGMTNIIFTRAMQASEDSKVFNMAKDLAAKQNAGKKISDAQVGTLVKHMAVYEAENATTKNQAKALGTEVDSKVQNVSSDTSVSQDTNNALVTKLIQSIPQIKDIEPVAVLSGEEFAKGEKSLLRQVGDFFKSFGGKAVNKTIGEVILNERGIKDSIAHGLDRGKSVAFGAVPYVIEKGKIIDYQRNWKDRGYDTVIIAAPVEIKGNTTYVGVVAIKETENSRYYLHEVITKEGDILSFKTGRDNKISLPGDIQSPSTDTIIHQNSNDVNTNNVQNSENNSSNPTSELEELMATDISDVTPGDIYISNNEGITATVLETDSRNVKISFKDDEGERVATVRRDIIDDLMERGFEKQVTEQTAKVSANGFTDERVDEEIVPEQEPNSSGKVITLSAPKNKNGFSINTNQYKLFENAEKIIIGSDIITDGYFAVVKTEENVNDIANLSNSNVISSDLSWTKVYDGSNNVVLSGDPKLYEVEVDKAVNGAKTDKNKLTKLYIFKVNETLYGVQQKYLDAFNNGTNIFLANKNPSKPIVVMNSDDLVGIIMPIRRPDIADFDNLIRVSTQIENNQAAVQAKKAEIKSRPVDDKTLKAFLDYPNDIPYYKAADGKIFVTNNHFIMSIDKAGLDYIVQKNNEKNTNRSSIEGVEREAIKSLVENTDATYEFTENPFLYKLDYVVFTDGSNYFGYNKKYVDIFNKDGNRFFVNSTDKGTHLQRLVVKNTTGDIVGIISPINLDDNVGDILKNESPVNGKFYSSAAKHKPVMKPVVKYSLEADKSSNLFKADEKVVENFANQVDAWKSTNSQLQTLLNSKSGSPQVTARIQELRGILGKPLNLGKTPAVLQELGADNLPIIITSNVVDKVTGGTDLAHEISIDELKKLPYELADPIMVFNSDTDKKTTTKGIPRSLVILTTLKNERGHEIVAAIHLNKKQGFTEINNVASIHSRTNTETGKNQIVNFVNNQLEAGNLRYADKNKSDEWLRSRRLQLPRLNTILASNNSILQKEDIVNSYYMQNSQKNSLEREDNHERGNLYSDGDVGREAGTDTNEQAKGMARGTRGAREVSETRKKSAADRRIYAENVKANGQVENRRKFGVQAEFVKQEAYNEDMSLIVAENEKKGLKTEFVVGSVKVAFANGQKNVRGAYIPSENAVIVQYDNAKYSPEQINKHELGHRNFHTKETQKVKNIIANSLSMRDKNRIVTELYRNYYEITDGNESVVFEEFVCDVLAGMNDYSSDFEHLVNDYWNGNEIVDIYSSATYAESIDAGGFVDNIGFGEVQAHYSINRSDLLGNVAFVDKNLVDKLKGESLNKAIKRFFDTNLKGLEIEVISTNNKINLDQIGKYLHPGEILPNYNIKQIAVNVLDDMIKIGENKRHSKDLMVNGIVKNHAGLDAKNGWDYYDTKFAIDNSGVIWGAEIIVRKSKNGKDYFYDINKIREIGYQDVNEFNPVKYSLTSLYNTTISQKDTGVNTNVRKNNKKDTEIRYSLESQRILDDLIKKYGVIEAGEKPSREAKIPKRIDEKRVVSKFARTMMEAGVTPDFVVGEFEKSVLNGTMTHIVITNKFAEKYAEEKIKYNGYADALSEWDILVKNSKIGKKEMVFGIALYNQAVTNKDAKIAMKIAADLVAEATEAGQTLQATRMLKLMGPDGQLYYIERSIQKMNDEFRDRIGQKYKDITLDAGLVEKFLTAETKAERNNAYDNLCQHIAEQIPATLSDKFSSWRYLAMLGNPRTHIRNILGNGAFIPALRINNYIGAMAEIAFGVKTEERTKSIFKSDASKAFAAEDFKNVVDELQGGSGKYATIGDIESKRKIFNIKILEKLRNKNFEWLEKEDLWFLKLHYVDSLARLITVRKFDVDYLNGGTTEANQTLEKLRSYAIQEAQAATYRDANSFADALNSIERRANRSKNKAIKASRILLEGIMPFKKTPLNIAKQGVVYSPVGILSGIYRVTKGVKNGEYTSTEAIDSLSKGLTGTGITLLGFFLSSLGILRGGDEEDISKKEKEFNKMVGEQSYSLNIGGKSYTIDWMVPLALPLFIGAEIHELSQKKGLSIANVIDSVSRLTDPLLELSVFSGISNVIQTAQYSKENPSAAIVQDMVISYVAQVFPTIGGQITRMIDKTKRNYYYKGEGSQLPNIIESLKEKTISKVPGASFLFEPSVDNWGREMEYGSIFERIAENTVSPGYYSEQNYTAVDNEIKRLYEYTGDESVFPITQTKTFTEDKVVYSLNAKQYTEAKKIRGRKSFELVEKLINSTNYSHISDENKVKALSDAYKKAGQYAKKEMLKKIK